MLLTPLLLLAAQTPLGLEVQPLPSPAGASSSLPSLVRGADGIAYLTWVERREGKEAVLQFAELEEEGWSAPREIVRSEELFLNWADFPSLAALQDGTLLGHWPRAGSSPHGYSAEYAISVDRGRSWSAPRRLHDDDSDCEHGFVSVAPLAPDAFGAIWLDGRAHVGVEHGEGETALYFRRLDATGEAGPERVLDPRVCDCCQTSLVAASEGRALAAYRDRTAEEVRDVSCLALTAEGWSSPESVHEDGWKIPGCPVNGPRLAPGAKWTAAAWYSGAGQAAGDVRVAFRKRGGEDFGFPLDVDDGRPMGRVDVVPAGEDSVFVTWLEVTEGNRAEWRVRRVGLDGSRSESEAIADVPAERSSGFMRMVATTGGAVLAWTTPGTPEQVETARLVGE